MPMDTNAAQSVDRSIDQLAVNTIRTLSMDAVQAANSGHPGTPMALAPVGYQLWQHHLRFDPELPVWANRDRFVLSAGHASALLYSLLHLAGVRSVNPDYETIGEPAVSLEDLRRFRQLDSKCPGHPEYWWTSGVECTTGPLGTGIATSVGMAMAGLRPARPGIRHRRACGHPRNGGVVTGPDTPLLDPGRRRGAVTRFLALTRVLPGHLRRPRRAESPRLDRRQRLRGLRHDHAHQEDQRHRSSRLAEGIQHGHQQDPRAVVERSIAHLKNWRILHTDYRRPSTHSVRRSPRSSGCSSTRWHESM